MNGQFYLSFLANLAPSSSLRLPINVGFAKFSSDTVRRQEAHSNGHVLDNIILSDPEVCTSRQEELRIRMLKPTPF
nr:ferredoxin-dependent glutamate synthase, chloroplastic [Tanacetum cinerariifolium]